MVIGPSMCKITHKRLLHGVVDLCSGLGPIGILVQFMAGHGCSGGYLSLLPLYVQLMIFTKFEKAY